MNLFSRVLSHVAVACTFLVVACGASEAPVPPEPSSAEAAHEPAAAPGGELDLGAVMRRVHFAFRPEAGGFSGGHSSFAVSVTEHALRVTPRNPAQGAREAREASPFIASTQGIARGGAPLPGGSRAPKLADDASLTIDRGVAVEHLENRDEGVEQSFAFAAKPAGRGDLTVRLAVSGQRFTGESKSGLHFADEAAGLGVVYGVATWIDAHGQRSAARVAYVEGSIAITVPASVIEESAYPAVLDPVIGPEVGMDNPVTGFAAEAQETPAVSFGGGQHLVVWRDLRNLQWDIFGARVSAAGVVLDPGGIAICTAGFDQQEPAVTWGGTGWTVVWSDKRSNVDGDLYGARISAAGAVLDPNGFALENGGSHKGAKVAFDGTNYLATYLTKDSTKINALRFGPTGQVLAATQTLAVFGVGQIVGATLAFNGTNHLVAYLTSVSGVPTVVGKRVTPAGVVLDANAFVISSAPTSTGAPSITTDGSGWFLAWSSNGSGQVLGQRVTAGGAPLDGASGLVVASGTTAFGVSTVYDGGGYGVFWGNGVNDFSAARVGANGVVVASAPGFLANEFIGYQLLQPAVSSDGTNYYFVFADGRSNNGMDIRGIRMSTALVKIDPVSVLVSSSANGQRNATLAFNGTNYLVAWEDLRNGASFAAEIHATRLSAAGAVLDPSGIPVSTGLWGRNLPAVASNGTDWLVTWEDERVFNDPDLYAARVSANGTVLEPNGLFIDGNASALTAPAVASDGAGYLVAWNNGNVLSRRVTAAGTLPDASPQLVALGAVTPTAPALAFNGTSYLVTWTKSGDVFGTRVTTQNQTIDPPASPLPLAVAAATSEGFPSVASNGTDWLVVCTRNDDVIGVRVTAGGGVFNPVDVSAAALDQYSARVAWDGAQYWAAWQDDRNGTNDVYASRISAAGVVLDPAGLVISATGEEDLTPAITGGPAGQAMVAYHRFDTAQPFGAMRVRGRILGGGAGDGAMCSLGTDCVSGFCTDGVCCNALCSGVCQACSAAKKGGGADGTCGPMPAGFDPENDCADLGAATCGTNGFCDGGGACQLYTAGTACGATCVGNSATPKTCNGLGTCGNGAGQPCSPYACAGGACKASCVNSNDCAAGFACNGGVCGNLAPNGAMCAAGGQCQSGSCFDGVCCNVACGGGCQACSAAKKGGGSDGVCGPVAVGTDPDSDCPQEAQNTCGKTGACDGNGACQLFAQGMSCGASICAGNLVKGQICNGSGSCVADNAGQDCAPFACAGGSCKNPCVVAGDCAAGNVCVGGACLPSGSQGTACGNGPECLSGLCVDGVCCDSACLGTCQACSAAKKGLGADGTCGPVKGNIDPDSECAVQVPSTCKQNGTCDGNGACGLYVAGTVCAAASCNGAQQTASSACDGLGTCVAGASSSCVEGYVCEGNTCATSCVDDSVCAAGFVCDLQFGACAPGGGTGGSGAGGNGTGGEGTGGKGTGGSGVGGAGTGGKGTGGAGVGGVSTTGTTGSTGTTSSGGGDGGRGATTTGSGGDGGSSSSGCGCAVVGDQDDERTTETALVLVIGAALLGRRRRFARTAH